MVIDMHAHPMLYKIYTPGDAPDGFDFWEREFGMGHMGPMDWDEIEVELDVCHVDKSVLMPLDVTSAAGGRFGTNDQIASLVAAHPDRLWGFASVDPQVSPTRREELERAFRDLGAKGLFLHPAKQGFCPGDASARTALRDMREIRSPRHVRCGALMGALGTAVRLPSAGVRANHHDPS